MANEKYTQAFNFVSALQGGVDPRTGLYSTSMSLASLTANAGLGPGFDIALTYSPVLTENKFSLGVGMSLGISSYDDKLQALQLSTGESYRTYSTLHGRVLPREQNIENFKLARLEEGYLLHHKSGMSERMTLCHGNTFVSNVLESPLGHKMTLVWHNKEGLRLEKVLDGNGQVLCSLDYVGEKIIISLLRPDSKSEGPLTIALTTENDYLKKITLGKMSWHLDYDPVLNIGGKQLLQRIIFPTGGQEEVTYASLHGHSYPVVNTYTVMPGSGFSAKKIHYHYSENNFMGSNLTLNNAGADSDGLYQYEGSYEYWSEETHEHTCSVTKISKPTVIKRTYNNFHLMIAEETRCGSAVHLTETEYNIKYNLPFAKQHNTLQFPRIIRQTWRKSPKASRTETTHHEYDDNGNLTKSVSPDGTITWMSYYSPAGEGPACPPSPQGLTWLMKSKTVIPPLSQKWADECAVRTLYTYQKVSTREKSHNSYAVMKDQETTYIGYVNDRVKSIWSRAPLALVWEDYDAVKVSNHTSDIVRDTSDVHFGRQIKSEVTLYAAGGTAYRSEQLSQYAYQEGVLSVTNHARTHDGLVNTERSEVSVYTGKIVKKTDAVGDEAHYFYDPVGRLEKVVYNADNQDRSVAQQYEYQLPLAASPAMTLFTDVRGNKFRISYDGLGREIQHELKNPDSHSDRITATPFTGQGDDWFGVKSLLWDDLGRKVSETHRDYLPMDTRNNRQCVTLSSTQEWDDWGGGAAVTGSDGIVHHTATDLVDLVTTTWLSGKNGAITSKTRVWFDPKTHSPVKKELLTPEGTVYSTITQAYDRMGRLRRATDENGNATTWDYDAAGRVVKTIYPDGSFIQKEYAHFSLSNHVTHLSLTSAEGKSFLLGTQRWDGLGRLIETISGGRKTIFHYQHAWQNKPVSQIGPDGIEIQLEQDVQLGGAITSVKAGDISHSFSYDKKTRHMTNAKVAQSDTSQEWALYPSGRLMMETSKVAGGMPHDTRWNYSLCGQPVNIVSNGWQQTCTYNALGRMEKLRDNAVDVTLTYDDLGRVISWVAEERLTKARMETTRVVDPFGRETSRHLKHSNGLHRIISQVWRCNNQMSERTCRDEHGQYRLKEWFSYDNRNRLINYRCEGIDLPADPYGNRFKGQEFVFDVLNNITLCRTFLENGEVNEARYFFSDKDPCQLTGVSNGEPGRERESSVENSDRVKTSIGYPRMIHLEYDDAGRMTLDSEGRRLTYDALGRLSGITGGSYGYDAHNRLVYQKVDKSNMAHRLYYRAEQLVNEWITEGDAKPDAAKDQQIRLVYAAGGCVAQETQQNGQLTTMLLGTNSKNSVVAQVEKNEVRENIYTPYGYVKRDE